MPPKSSSSKEKDLTDEDEVLQAVILADSFNKRFKPLTSGKPRCLLPVCNATLLDWTFESLALAGVQEIFVVCRSYPELVKAAIRDSKWSKPSLGLKIVPIITSKETFTPGDAMRDIYTRGIITSDFVLVMGDLVSNIRIDEVVRVHKERRRTNKDAIMTLVVKPSGVVHRTRSKGESAIFVLDTETSECLHYEHVTGYPPKKHAKIPREILAEHPEIEIRNDLIDCGIDVCSVEVPSLFQDNFDYGDIRRDFVHGVLTSDLLMKSIHCYVAREGYAARVADTRSYDSVSKDILARWTFPLVPDDNHPGGHSYEHIRGNKYLAKGNSVVLSRTCKVGSNCLIGAGTHIADNANIQASVIGQRCTVEANVTLRNVYVFDDTHIGAGSVVEYSIVGSNVKVGEGSTVARGCLIGDGVILGKNAKLGEFERVSRRRDEGEADESDKEDEDEQSEDSELEEAEARQDSESITAIIGEGSNAIVWPKGPRADEEDLDEVERYNNQRLMRIGDPASDLPLEYEGTESDSDASERESDESDLEMHALSRISSATSTSAISTATPGLNIHTLHDAAAYSEFQAEVTQSLDRAFAEGHSVDNAAVELKTLRMASNVPLRKVREAVVASIVERIEVVEGDAAAQRREISKMVGRWGPLIDKIGGVDPVETIEVLQYHCAKSARLPLFGQILAALYQDDIVEEDDIRAWHVRPEAKGEGLKDTSFAENVRRCWLVGAKMIEQFNEQESSEESGEEESDEEEQPSKKSAAATAQAAVGKKEESSEEESSSGDDESGEDDSEESEDDAPAAKAAIDAPSQPSKPASTPAGTREESEEESEDSEEEESEDDALAPSQPAASKPSASSTTPVVSATPSAPPPVPAAHASEPAPVSSTAAPAQPSTQDEESSGEESESGESDKEPAQTAQSQAPPPPPASSKQPVAAPFKAESEESESSEDSEEDEEESEDDAASRATEPVPQAQVSTPKASTETARPPATITTQTESVATIPAAVPRPRPGPDVVGGKQNPVVAPGSGQVASEGATTSRATATATSSVASTQHSLRGQGAQERDHDGGEGEESGDDSGETDEEGDTDDSKEE